MKKYIVREGDTMWNISKATGVRLNLLMAANPQISDPNQLKPGAVVVIPELHKGNTHGTTVPTVDKAPSYGVPVQTPPVPTPTPGPTPPPQSTAPSTPGGPVQPMAPYFGFVWPHVVKPHEDWATIAGEYKVDMAHLKQMNPAHANQTLQTGDIVYIPGKQAMSKPSVGPSSIGQAPQPGMEPTPYPQAQPYAQPEAEALEGPHSHHPYRYPVAPPSFSPYAVGPNYRVPHIPPGMWAFVPAPSPYPRGGYYPMPGLSPYFQVPATWYRDMDDSSSWDASWSSSTTYRGDEWVGENQTGAAEWFGESRDDARAD